MALFIIVMSPLLLAAASPLSKEVILQDGSPEVLLSTALEAVSAPGDCGLSAPPLALLPLNASPPFINPFLQAARDACQLLSFLPGLGEPSMSPSVLGVLWRTLMNKVQKPPLGVVYFEAREGTVWILYDSELQPTRFTLINGSTNSNESLSVLHSGLAAGLRKAVLSNETNFTPSWSLPFWDCHLKDWVLAANFPVAGRGAMALILPLQYVDINQCDDDQRSKFAGSHKCDQSTTQCVFLDGMGFRSGGYECRCIKGYFNPEAESDWSGFPGSEAEVEPRACVPCPEECAGECEGGRCMAHHNPTLRGILLAVQSLCLGITVGLAFVVFRHRKRKPIASSMWTVLETILLGTLLLYTAVVIRFFPPSVEFCLLEAWCRELGFVVCYGAIILKLYRILIEFRTRKAHRWVVRDKDLLKYLLAMVLIAVGYLSAHTATALHTMQVQPDALMAQGRTLEGIKFPTCKVLWWDFVTQTGEIGMLLFGIHLSIASRNATTQFHERRFLYLALIVEGIVSGLFYILRGLVWTQLHPDVAFVAYVIRSQLSNTSVLLLLFLPKWWYCRQAGQQRPSPGRLQPGPLLGEGHLPASPAIGPCMDAEFPDISLADMNPEDIRAELKRLYTQLEVLKNKTIRYNNPHISKRRGGRKVAHRRFSLQALHHRQKSSKGHHGGHHDHDGEGEVSRTPEDSVCSIEGPSAIFNDGPSVAYSELGYPRK